MSRQKASILDLIRQENDFLLTSHINPDGDSVSSQLALRLILRSLGKRCTVVNSHPVPRVYRFLPGAEHILVRRRHSLGPYSALFVLDCGNPSRASGLLGGPSSPTVVNIDHHISNTLFGDLNWVDPKVSSTCELVYEIGRRLGVPMERDIAVNLYAGILTDTGSFRYSSTTARCMSIAGRLLRHGVDPHEIAEKIYENSEYASLRLLGKVLARLGRSEDGRVAWITFSHAELSSLSNASETEEFVNYARSLDTSVLAIGLKEIVPGEVRISFRSKGEIDVAELASRYGGGGHRNAAGCTVEGGLKSVQNRIVAAACRFLEDFDRSAAAHNR